MSRRRIRRSRPFFPSPQPPPRFSQSNSNHSYIAHGDGDCVGERATKQNPRRRSTRFTTSPQLHGEFAPFTPLSLQDTRLINRIRRRVFNTGPRNAQSQNLFGLRIDESTIVRVFGRRRSSLCRGLIDPEFLYQITASQAIKFRSTDSPLLLLLLSSA